MDCISKQLQLFLVGLLLAFPLPLFAAAGKVVIAAGDVFAVNAQDERRPLQRRSDVFEGDTLITGADGRLQLRFEDNAILALRADSQLRISEYHGASDSQPERVLMDLLGGGFRTISGSFGKSERDAYQVRTPNASIGIRGTHYEAVFESATLTVGVYEGGIVLTNDQGSLNLGLDSEFVFAQVQAGNLPQGLLNPPANLNVPNTPQSDDEGEDEEESGEESTDDSDSEANADSTVQPTDNVVTSTAASETNTGNFTADDFNFSALEDALNTLGEDTLGTVKLTTAESTALTDPQTAKATGILVFAPSDTGNNGESLSENGPIVAYGSSYANPQQDGNTVFFVAYENQSATNDLTDEPNFVARTNASAPSPEGSMGLQENNWGIWDYDSSDKGATEAGINTSFTTGSINEPFYFIEAEPTSAKLTGEMSFYLCEGCLEATGMNITYSDGQLFVSLDTLSASGYLSTYFEGQVNYETWDMAFEGNINGSVLEADIVDGITIDYGGEIGTVSSAYVGQDNQSHALTGNVTGIFSGGEEGSMSFIGGFTAESIDSDDEAYGVFVMEESEPVDEVIGNF